ncbi:MAG TPA: EAL domain-containing protein [Gammaproteobacteria bacterium]
MNHNNDTERERDYYRALCNDLGGQLLKIRDEHTRAMAGVRRARMTAALIRRLYHLDHVNLDVANLARVFLETALNALTVECAALFRLDDNGHGFRLLHAIGFTPPAEGILADVRAPAGFHFHSSASAEDEFSAELKRLADAPFHLWAYDAGTGTALYFGNREEDLQLRQRFDAADAEAIEAALDVFINVAERKRVERQLVHDAFHDGLTGLPNRALFIEHLDQAMRRSVRADGYVFSVLFLDLDRFKLVNDSLGHAAGDELLKAFAERLEQSTRPGDIVSRLGGDEFAVLADDLHNPDDAIHLAERIHNALQDPFDVDGQQVFSSASIGIAKSAERYKDGEDLLRDADIAMYSAKELGGASHRLFDSDMHVVMVSRLQLETDLRQALEREELRVAYQPIVELRNGQLRGFEALLRWRHPLKGSIRPREFISMAEETGLVVPIGRWLLWRVMSDLGEWLRDFPERAGMFVSLNVSDREFIQPEFAEIIDAALAEANVPAGALELELTERMLMHYSKLRSDTLPRLRERGISIAIDDFGTGYSSLSRLQRLPIDKLKIDQSFIRDMDRSEENYELVRTILAMGQSLGMRCVAEGVERREQYDQLRELNCDFAQGFFIAKPLAAHRVRTLLEIRETA